MQDNNIYYNPKAFGLQIIALMELGGSYEFDTHVVFANEQGELFYANDAGCSCPTPFERHTMKSLEPITAKTWPDFYSNIMSNEYASMSDKRNFLEEVRCHIISSRQ